jgi:CTP:phosphocholine cytidylyltransferase-like protein
MSIRMTVEVRLVSSKKLAEEFVTSMDNWLRRDGFRLAKQPAYYLSRKDPDDIRVYTEWVKEKPVIKND